jgi:catalase
MSSRSSQSGTLARYIPAVATTDVSQRLVAAIRAAYGVHPGRRAAHAKGSCCRGEFRATPEIRALSRASVFNGDTIPVTARFSNGAGDPDRPDTALDGRGLAVKFHLAGGAELDLVGLSQPVFFVRDLDTFIEFSERRNDRAAIEAWLGGHPEALPAVMHLMTTPAAASYTDVTYHGIHAFRLVGAAGQGRWARYRWIPADPAAPLSSEERKQRSPDYLQEELATHGPAEFRLEYQLAAEGDPIDDPTAAWPDDRETVVAGRLLIQGPQPTPCEELVFDPLHLVDGIEPSPDPILQARPGAYSISITERLGL